MAQKPRTVICIGDIHGHIQKLNKLWSNLQAALDPSEFSSALVIFLGDYCDRGPHTKQVIDFLISLPERYPDQTHVFLAGNHDFAFAAFLGLLDGPNLEETWKKYTRYESYEKREGWYKGEGFEKMHYQGRRWGGIMEPPSDSVFGVVSNGSIYDAGSTFESYGVPHGSSDLKEAVPASHKKFLTDMVWVHEENEVYVETEEGLKKSKLIAVHAGLWKGKSLDEQLEPLRARDTSITGIQAMGARATTVLEISQELDNTIIDSGHYGEPHINGVSTINETRGSYMDMPLAAIVLPFKKTIRDIDIFPN